MEGASLSLSLSQPKDPPPPRSSPSAPRILRKVKAPGAPLSFAMKAPKEMFFQLYNNATPLPMVVHRSQFGSASLGVDPWLFGG